MGVTGRPSGELAKAWLVRLIERASLDEIRDLPTDSIARELPEPLSDLVGACAENNGSASLAALRAGRDVTGVAELSRDVAAINDAARLGGDEPPVTLSIGVVSSPEHGDAPEATDGTEVADEAKSQRLATTR